MRAAAPAAVPTSLGGPQHVKAESHVERAFPAPAGESDKGEDRFSPTFGSKGASNSAVHGTEPTCECPAESEGAREPVSAAASVAPQEGSGGQGVQVTESSAWNGT